MNIILLLNNSYMVIEKENAIWDAQISSGRDEFAGSDCVLKLDEVYVCEWAARGKGRLLEKIYLYCPEHLLLLLHN